MTFSMAKAWWSRIARAIIPETRNWMTEFIQGDCPIVDMIETPFTLSTQAREGSSKLPKASVQEPLQEGERRCCRCSKEPDILQPNNVYREHYVTKIIKCNTYYAQSYTS